MNKRTKKSLAEILIDNDLITQDQWLHVQALVRTGRPVRQALIELNLINDEQFAECMAEQADVLRIDLSNHIIEPKVIESVSEATARKYKLIPVLKVANTLTCALVDVFDIVALDEVALETGLTVEPAIATEKEILGAIKHYYSKSASMQKVIKEFDKITHSSEISLPQDTKLKLDEEESAPVIDLVNSLVSQAVRQDASDVHIEPEENSLTIRFRIDGVLYEQTSPDKKAQASIISRIKIMSGLDIAEHRRPQDGRFKVVVDERNIDVRVSSAPTIYGENIVMRLLDTSFSLIGLHELGFGDEILPQFQEQLKNTNGIILVTGPTGSGKTTTLYAALKTLNTPDKNIVTIEDPVEYRLSGVRQMQVNPEVDLTFSTGLRSILRQDPDIIMVGEIRDLETAEIAIQAALTGHLVLATLHANDAPGAVTRLIDMGIEPFLISSSVNCVLAQRLVRLLCSDCKSKGCRSCLQRGYKGRKAIYELMQTNSDIRELINKRSSSDEIRRFAVASGMISLREDGLSKVDLGLTSKEEVFRVTHAV